ncbi:MAG: hypothetical protein ACYSW3_29765 [Planctomycetota bacterium]|jgi:hypothetical protein
MVKIPYDPSFEEGDDIEWSKHWAAHEQDACLPGCQVCEAMADEIFTLNRE